MNKKYVRELCLALDMYVLGQGVKTGVYRVCDELFPRLIGSEDFLVTYLLRKGFENASLCYIRKKGLPENIATISDEKSRPRVDILLSPFGVAPKAWREAPGVLHAHIIYDLIAIHHPEFFTPEAVEEVKNIVFSLDKSTVIFAISEYTKQDLLAFRTDLNPDQVVVIPLAASDHLRHCDDLSKRIAVRTRYSIPIGVNYLLSLATLEVRKNLDQVVRAYIHYMDAHPESNLHLVLSGMFGWKLEKLYDALATAGQWRNRIVLTGYVEDEELAALYSDALCFLYLSRYEGFGLPPLEAMACGTPVITSNNSSLPEVVGSAGLTFDADDINGISAAIAQLVEVKEFRDQYVTLASERAKHFSWDRCAKIVQETLLKALKNQRETGSLRSSQTLRRISASFNGYENGSFGPSFKKSGWKSMQSDGTRHWPVWTDKLGETDKEVKLEGGLRTRGQFKSNMPNCPLVTYVTVVRNNEKTLDRTIESVQRQTYLNVEHIILDGASTDNTVAVIRQFENKLDYFVSEPDHGLYDALNKAIPLARGNLICVLNSDDWLEPNSAEIAVKHLGAGARNNLLFTSAKVRLDSRTSHHWQPAFVHPGSYFLCANVCHNGIYATRSAYEKSGPYDITYEIAADFKWIMQCLDSGSLFCYTKEITVNYSLGGVSGNSSKHGMECWRVIKDRFPFLEPVEVSHLHNGFFVFATEHKKVGDMPHESYTEFIRGLLAKYAMYPDFLQALSLATVVNTNVDLGKSMRAGDLQCVRLRKIVNSLYVSHPTLYKIAAIIFRKIVSRV